MTGAGWVLTVIQANGRFTAKLRYRKSATFLAALL